MKNNIAVILQVYNEELRIQSCLNSFLWADELLLIDKSSTDRTVEIAKNFTKKIAIVPFSEGSKGSSDNINRFDIKSEWIFFVTAASLIHPDIVDEIIKLTISNNFEYDVCVRIRPDLFFDELGKNAALWSFNIPRDNFIHTVHCGYDGEFPYFYAGDIFYYANSKTFDIINDFYNRIDDIDVKLFEKEVVDEKGNVYKTHGHTRLENLFVHYYMQNNIKIRALPHGPYVTGSSIFLDDPEARKRLKKYGF